MGRKRITWIDVAKGVLILLVILGHSNITNITAVVINSFHMAAFFVLSGITYRCDEITFDKFLKKKFISLLLSYVAFSLLMLIYFFAKKIVFHGYTFDIISGLVSIVLPVSGRISTTVYGLWFFPCLFVAEIIMYALLYIFRRTTSYLLTILSYIVFCAFCWGVHIYSNLVSVLDIIPIAVLYLAIGKIVQKKLKSFEENYVYIGISSGILFLSCVYCNYHFSHCVFDLSSMVLGIWPLYILSGIFGTALISSLAIFISRFKWLEKIGKDSMFYYGLHYEFIGAVEKTIKEGILQTVVTVSILYLIIFLFKRVRFLNSFRTKAEIV